MGKIRTAAVAGSFYPAQKAELEHCIKQFLGNAKPVDIAGRIKAMIVPHAGYIYSGPIAASAYSQLVPMAGKITRVVLMGPAHLEAVNGMALSDADSFVTPLGSVPVSKSMTAVVEAMPQVCTMAQAHRLEHCLEVQIPFLQMVLNGFELLPILVGSARSDDIARVLESVWGGDETLIVISSDLSHYLNYQAARERDKKTALAIEQFNAELIPPNGACGVIPISGFLPVAKKMQLRELTLDLRSSGDTYGSQDSVVGYGSFLFYQERGNG